MAFIFKIKLRDVSKPPVWRRVAIPHEYSLEKTHCVIQAVFGWFNEHMYKFSDKPYGGSFEIKPLFEEDEWMYDDLKKHGCKVIDSADIRLCDIFNGDTKKLLYVYDFSDDWIHEMVLEDIVLTQYDHAVCITGKGMCPPENCGGPGGYEYMKEVLTEHPDSEEAREMRRQLDLSGIGEFDPGLFNRDDIHDINELLVYIEENVK